MPGREYAALLGDAGSLTENGILPFRSDDTNFLTDSDTPRTRRSKLSLFTSIVSTVFGLMALVLAIASLREITHSSERKDLPSAFRRHQDFRLENADLMRLPRPLRMLVAEEDILREVEHILAERGASTAAVSRSSGGLADADRLAAMAKLSMLMEEEMKHGGR